MLAPVSSVQLLHELVGFSNAMNNHPKFFVGMNGKSKLSTHFPPMIGCFSCSILDFQSFWSSSALPTFYGWMFGTYSIGFLGSIIDPFHSFTSCNYKFSSYTLEHYVHASNLIVPKIESIWPLPTMTCSFHNWSIRF